jgi:ferrous iron transport protein B
LEIECIAAIIGKAMNHDAGWPANSSGQIADSTRQVSGWHFSGFWYYREVRLKLAFRKARLAMAGQAQLETKKIVLIGNPNVGKSVIFRLLTGSYVLVSNFPGTTVEVSRGKMLLGRVVYEVVDTPGINSLIPQSEDERVTCEILLREKPDVIIQVADAKNLRRTLLITSQLVEFDIPMILVLNMIDEAEDRGIEIDSGGLSQLFSIPVVETIAIFSKGRKQLLNAIQNAHKPRNPLPILYGEERIIQASKDLAPPALLSIEWMAEGNRELSQTIVDSRGSALAELRKWQERYRFVTGKGNPSKEIAEIRNRLLDQSVDSYKKKRQIHLLEESGGHKTFWLGLLIFGLLLFAWNEMGDLLRVRTPYNIIQKSVDTWVAAAFSADFPGSSLLRSLLVGDNPSGRFQYGLLPEAIHFLLLIAPVIVPLSVLLSRSRSFAHELGIWSRRASTGIPILLVVLLLLYEFVGYTGAQTLVGFLEKGLFGQQIIPLLQALIPSGFFWELLVGKYGIISMGLTYAIGIVLPVVGTFFIAFGLLEDSGYLPRLSILSDRLMRIMGLNGKAVLPMVLGFGCGTMATMSTRILSSKRERLIAILLLALGIPCSAQLGVMLGIAAGFSQKATLVVIGVVASQVLLVGFLSSLLIRGKPSEFIFEIPPIRVPQLKNVWFKTWFRVQWYLKEAVPLFLIGTLVLFVCDNVQLLGRSLLAWIQSGLEPVLTGLLHLPSQVAGVFLLGFLRRDYGAAGLYDMARRGLLTGQQVVVSMIVITLFVPCLASFLMIIKEQGLKRAFAIMGFIVPFAIGVGAVVSWVLRTFNIQFN